MGMMPLTVRTTGEPLTLYERQKAQGVRRENGAMKLNRLSGRHLKMISMHLAGMTNNEICHEIGCTPATCSRILNDPLSQAVIRQAFEDKKNELRGLAGDAVAAVRDGLDHRKSTINQRLKAVNAYSKLHDSFFDKRQGERTAEDVVEDLLGRVSHLTINQQRVDNLQIVHQDDRGGPKE